MMRGQVLEIGPDDPGKAVAVLRAASEAHRLRLEEVALYGAMVHVVAPEVEKQMEAVIAELLSAGVEPGEMAVIEPSLEDVFVACMQ
jgi:hypothetical protein